MKTSLLLLPTAFLAVSTLSALDAPVLQERFNDSANVDFVNGAALGAAGSGVSGRPDDMAYVAPDFNPDDQMQPAGILLDSSVPQEMEQITVMLWYKISQPLRDATTLFNGAGCYLLWQSEPANGWNMRLEMPIETKMRAWFNPRGSAVPVPWTAAGEWIFYAFTWEKTGGAAVVYQGASQVEAREVKRFESAEAREFLGHLQSNVVIGNSYDNRTRKPGTRAFGGAIDNVRVFGAALKADDIEKVRAADVSNTPL